MIKKYKIDQFYILIFMPNWGTIYPSGYVDGGNDENHAILIIQYTIYIWFGFLMQVDFMTCEIFDVISESLIDFQWKGVGQIFRKCVVSAPVLFVFLRPFKKLKSDIL